MRKLSTEQRASILACLVEGNSVASTCRMTGASKITVLRLLADVGTFCASYHDEHVRNLYPARVQVDEAWGFVGAKDKAVLGGANAYGSAWTWVAIDADSKIVIAHLTGNRDADTARAFLWDLSDRIDSRVQLTSDGHGLYKDAVKEAFGGNVDFAQLFKEYGRDLEAERRYSPPVCISTTTVRRCGTPDPQHVSTSFVERQNLTIRMQTRRMTRLTNAFSKKIENHIHALDLHFWWYNFARKHNTIKTTPAVANGLADRPLTAIDLVRMLEGEESRLGSRLAGYLPACSK
ncbi:MAG: DDE-type integrase/transposase/recombinase [Phycisphaeraceae bacterium]|nr:DDE-type integrase/transposase/recombinase [Phycisphaeraceae bacterium]MCW5761609.1 DDE-type integrase/transposase/recombinase [Phycisphaeraceae bacterium]